MSWTWWLLAATGKRATMRPPAASLTGRSMHAELVPTLTSAGQQP